MFSFHCCHCVSPSILKTGLFSFLILPKACDTHMFKAIADICFPPGVTAAGVPISAALSLWITAKPWDWWIVDPAPWGLTGVAENSSDDHRKDSPGKHAVGLQGSISSQDGSQRASVLCFLRRLHPPLLCPLIQDARGLTRWCWQSMSNFSVIDLAYIVFLFFKNWSIVDLLYCVTFRYTAKWSKGGAKMLNKLCLLPEVTAANSQCGCWKVFAGLSWR